jgi:hypothetical protein
LWVVNASGFGREVPLVFPGAAAFVAGRPDAIVTDRATGDVLLLNDVATLATRTPIFKAGEDSRDFAAVAATPDLRLVLIALATSGAVTVVERETGITESLACGCRPTGFHPLIGGGIYRLNELTGAPLALLDVSSPEPRMFVVPSTSDAGAESFD